KRKRTEREDYLKQLQDQQQKRIKRLSDYESRRKKSLSKILMKNNNNLKKKENVNEVDDDDLLIVNYDENEEDTIHQRIGIKASLLEDLYSDDEDFENSKIKKNNKRIGKGDADDSSSDEE